MTGYNWDAFTDTLPNYIYINSSAKYVLCGGFQPETAYALGSYTWIHILFKKETNLTTIGIKEWFAQKISEHWP